MTRLILTWTLSIVLMTGTQAQAAGGYMEAATGLFFVDAPADIARPVLGELRAGYARNEHRFELALMTAIKDDRVNQLEVDVPRVVSLLYRYVPERLSPMEVHYILGASRVEVDSSFPGLPPGNDSFSGVSFGLGFEESFQSLPRLKLSIDLLQLYAGDDLDVYAATVGVNYAF